MSGRGSNLGRGYKVLGTGNPRVPPTGAWGQSTTKENRRGGDTRAMDL